MNLLVLIKRPDKQRNVIPHCQAYMAEGILSRAKGAWQRNKKNKNKIFIKVAENKN